MATRITNGDGQYFFGYYDVQAWSADGSKHLCQKTAFRDRLPVADDVAEIGVIDVESRGYEPLAETTAWNFQQGAMLQYRPGSGDREIVFNIREGEVYRGCILDLQSGSKRLLERPVASVSPDGKLALSINFDRMFAFRPGYGYAGGGHARLDDDHPDDDGVFLMDMETGKARLIISLDQIYARSKDRLLLGYHKLVVNHLGFNTDGSRFVFLTRYFPPPGTYSDTLIATAAADGSGMRTLTGDYRYASHYHWRDPAHLLIHAADTAGKQLYLLTDGTKQAEVVNAEIFLRDGHCNYSPDREWILYDSYPGQDRKQALFIYNVKRGEKVDLGQFLSTHSGSTDIRCDLHPRWRPDGMAISFDSTHEECRGIYTVDLEGLI